MTMEIWDIYDENMNKTGKTMERDNWSMQPGEYHVSVLSVVQRPDKKYLITQRKMDKAVPCAQARSRRLRCAVK